MHTKYVQSIYHCMNHIEFALYGAYCTQCTQTMTSIHTHALAHTHTHRMQPPHTQSITTHLQTHTHTPESKHMNRGSIETSKHVQTWQDSKGQPLDALGFFGAILQTCPRRIYDITTYTFNNYIYKHAINMPKGAMNNWKSKAWHLYIYIHMHVLHDTPNNIYIHYLMINMTRSHRPAARWREGGSKPKRGMATKDVAKSLEQQTWK